MNYKNIYDKLIKKSINRILYDNVYYENHHIIPKSLGGSNKKENRVFLTAREHFIAHKLLFKIYNGKSKVKMGYALHRMMFPNNEFQNKRITSRKYEELKNIYLYLNGKNHPSFGKKYDNNFKSKCSKNKIGEKNPMFGKKPWNYNLKTGNLSLEHKEKISESLIGRKLSKETKRKISEIHKNKKKSKEHCNKISKTLTGRKLSDETKMKMSNSKKGISQKKIKCPYCEKKGGITMYRWHFDNCKLKEV